MDGNKLIELTQRMAKPVDETLQEESGERLGFVLMCFEFGEGENQHFSYVSNAGRA